MLLVISLLLIYIDIPVGNVNVIPDVAGYILLVIALLAYRKSWGLKSLHLILGVLCLALSVVCTFVGTSAVTGFILYVIYVAATAVLLWLLIDRLKPVFNTEPPEKKVWPAPRHREPSEEELLWKTRISMGRTCILFLFLGAVCGLPLMLFSTFSLILTIFSDLVGITLSVVFYQLYRDHDA